MAFSATRSVTFHCGGGKSISCGTFTQSADTDTGGEISSSTTGLNYIDFCMTQVDSHLGTEVIKATINSSGGGDVTLVTSTGTVSGLWFAIGN